MLKDNYMKKEFQTWLGHQKKSNGESYKPATINAYTNAIKNATMNLELNEDVFTDLFWYTDFRDFEKAHKLILNAPNFNNVDISAGNRAYSNGMILYGRFLKELNQPACWIFQGNPKYYDMISAVAELDVIQWATNQYKNRIKSGDKAYMWMSGPNGGIVAEGIVLCNPEMRPSNPDDPYLRSETLNNKPHYAVDIQINKKLINSIVLRTTLLNDERTKNLEILTYPNATNFPVSEEQDEVITSLIDGTYVKAPVISNQAMSTALRKEEKRYWVYAPGEGSYLWNEFYEKGIMAIGWGEIGDLSCYSSKSEMKEAMKTVYGDNKSYKNDGHATWQFANVLKPGDIIFVKCGIHKFVGRGVVNSDYVFDQSGEAYPNIRKVNWTHNGEWQYSGTIVQKTLTDITPYTDYCNTLENMFIEDIAEIADDVEYCESYTEESFLSDVYMSEKRYKKLKNLLLYKKNIILEGAPGVGKTFTAKRLAFSIMGQKDEKRVKVVQFHQSYSYEDFILGYRPKDNGFSLECGPFYEFCKEAEPDDRDYFFIIDEINRGNLSKIFGELLMLIENDKREEKYAMRLLYSNEKFFVPQNVHIIGMMNTADRSLAMIDYALRRRFAFFRFKPAFETEGFKTYQDSLENRKFNLLVQTVVMMNNAIKEDLALGDGFQIGHSYFCTEEKVDEEWLANVVEFEIVPLIHEYWFDEPDKVDLWTKRLHDAIK